MYPAVRAWKSLRSCTYIRSSLGESCTSRLMARNIATGSFATAEISTKMMTNASRSQLQPELGDSITVLMPSRKRERMYKRIFQDTYYKLDRRIISRRVACIHCYMRTTAMDTKSACPRNLVKINPSAHQSTRSQYPSSSQDC